MSERPSNAPQYAYELPLDVLRPDAGRNAREWVIRREPIQAGQRLTTGEPPHERQWEVVAVEPTSSDGLRLGLLSGPIGRMGRPSAADVIQSGRLVLRTLA